MSTLGKSDHQREVVRAGRTLTVTARTPGQGGNGNDLRAEDGRMTTRTLAMKEGELWRHQPLTECWPQWSAENSDTLRHYLENANTNWSRGAPVFTVTPEGLVTMSWGGAEQVPMLVVDQLRGDDDNVEPPQHAECTYTVRKRMWLLNLTVVARSMPRADIDRGHLHDYRKALRLCVTSACKIMRKPPPHNYHTKIALWEISQEPQPAPFTLDQAAFEAYRERRLQEAQKYHLSKETHWRRSMQKFQRRAQAAEEGELARRLETTDDTGGLTETNWPRANQGGKRTRTTPPDDWARHGDRRVPTHREEREREAVVRYSTEEATQSGETHRAAAEGEKVTATKEYADNKERGTKAVSCRAEIQRSGMGTQLSGSKEEAVAQAQAGTKENEPKSSQVLRPRVAGLWGEEELPRSNTAARSATRSSWAPSRWGEVEPPTAGTTTEAVEQADTRDKKTQSSQVLRPWAAGPWEEENSLRPETTTPPTKRSKGPPTVSWTAAQETDHRGREDSLRRYHARETTKVTRQTRPEYPGPLLFGIDAKTRTLYPHIEPGAMEILLQGMDEAIEDDSRLRQISTIEEWRQRAAVGDLDNLGKTVAGKVGTCGGQINWTEWQGAPTTHMAQIVMDRVVQELKTEHLQTPHPRRDQAASQHRAARTQRLPRRKAEDRRGDRTLTPIIRNAGNRLAHGVAEAVIRQLNEESGAEATSTELGDKGEVEGQAAETPNMMSATEDLSEDTSGEEDDPPRQGGWRLPQTLATLLECAAEALWSGLSAKATKILLHEVANTINDSEGLRELGSDKKAWRSHEARTILGTRGEALRRRLRQYHTFNGTDSDDKMSEEAFPGQAIIEAAWSEWLRDDTATAAPQAPEHLPKSQEQTMPISGLQMIMEVKEDAVHLRRGRGCIGPLRREGNFTLEDGTRIQGRIRISRLPTNALEQPEEWNTHMHICQQGCELLPQMTPTRLRAQLQEGLAMTISFHAEEQGEVLAVLFMRPLTAIRGSKLSGYTVDGIAVQAPRRGRGLGTFLLQVAQEEAVLAAREAGQEAKAASLSITVQESLYRWLYPLGFTKNVEGRTVRWGANSANLYWQPDDLDLATTRTWQWTARGMINPDSLCQLVAVLQVLLGNDVFTRHLVEATWPQWRAGDTLLRLMIRPRDPSIEAPTARFRGIQDQRHLSKELILRLYYVLKGKGGEERKLSEQQDAAEMLEKLSNALDEEQAEQQSAHLQGTQPSWTKRMWGVVMCATRCCTVCCETRVMSETRDSEIRLVATAEDQLLAEQLQHLTEGMEAMEANLCDCGKITKWDKGTDIASIGTLLWVHINRNQVHERYRMSGRMRCPTTLTARTAQGMVELRLTGLVIHTGKTAPVTLPDGRKATIVEGGHYTANVHRKTGATNTGFYLDDSATPLVDSHPGVFSSLDMIRTEGGGVESLALYERSDTSHSAQQYERTDTQLRLSFGSLGVTVLDCTQRGPGGLNEPGTKHHDLGEPKSWSIPKEERVSMQAAWGQTMLNADNLTPVGPCPEELQRHWESKEWELGNGRWGREAIGSVLRNLRGSMKNRTLWPQARIHLITSGHYWEPLTCAVPMVAWFGGVHTLANGMTAGVPQTGITMMFFSDESLRLAGLEGEDANSDWSHERLTSNLQKLGWHNGVGIHCRIVRLTEERPVVTWPGNWHAYVVGDSKLNDEGKCCSLITTAWRPEARQRIAQAKESLNSTGAEKAMRRLERLGFPPPARRTALAWLQDGNTQWTTPEQEFMTTLELQKQGSKGPEQGAPPVKEPKKRAAP